MICTALDKGAWNIVKLYKDELLPVGDSYMEVDNCTFKSLPTFFFSFFFLNQ